MYPEWFENAAVALLGEGSTDDLSGARDRFRISAENDGERWGQWYALCDRAIEIHGH